MVDTHKGMRPQPDFEFQMAANVMAPFMLLISGEFKTAINNAVVGAARKGAIVANVWLSVEESGKDDTNDLSFTGDVYINGTTCLTTAPIIAHVSGEASQQKTTKVTGDTGITQVTINTDANTLTDGDILTVDLVPTRTATPTTEMRNAVLVVELQPRKP